MKLGSIIELLNAEVLAVGKNIEDIEIESVGAADLMSEVLAYSNSDALLLTGLTTPQVIRTAQMMDLAAVVFVRGKSPMKETIILAEKVGIPVILTRELLFDACGKLYMAGLAGCYHES